MNLWENLGTAGGHVEIVPYSAAWPQLFESEAQRIQAACGDLLPVIEHIGSTAIPGMSAKPILDIMPGLRTHADGLRTIEPLKRLGYDYHGENGIPGRYYFVLRYEQRSIIHVHIFEIGVENWERHLLFRDTLRAYPELAAEYAALKQDLAVRFREDREGYTDAKSDFIHSVVQQARRLQAKTA
ncbi:MAG: GrpB family protein [Anaerolineae bacterium]|jgi:GrpB-like predicted nucleotidyltransferase (UPF0157 family)|nr:GrpB family protein [Anaerolineae bacterium]